MQFTAADAIALVALAIGLAKIFTGPIGAALAERIRGARASGDPALAGEVDDLRGRLAEVEDVRGRLAEVEERLDFAERLLAQAREADQLHGGAQR
jgi:F0F1-type ATP synthase membrane subunit b/b'